MTEPEQPTTYDRWRAIHYDPTVKAYLPDVLLDLLRNGSRILDVGCGEGAVTRFLASAGMAVTGTDINVEAIEAAAGAAAEMDVTLRPAYVAGDFLTLELPQQPFDAVTLIRVLTCFPEPADWRHLLQRAHSMIVPGGLLYVHDFRYDAANPAYAARYAAGVSRGWRAGAFEVRPGGGDLAFVAYHHDDAALAEIAKPYDKVLIREHAGASMTGNRVAMFEFVGRKV